MKDGFNFKELSAISKENHYKNGFISYVLFIFASLLAGGLILLNLFFSYLFIFLVPLLVIPFLFAAQTAIMLLKEERFLTFKSFLRCFVAYFSEHFRSNYRLLRSALFALIFYAGMFLTSFIVVVPTFLGVNYLGMRDLFNSVSLTAIYDTAVLEELITDYRQLFETLMICISFPSLTMFVFAFAYLCSKNAYSHVYRMNDYKHPGKYITDVAYLTRKNNKKLYLKCFWSLNWPLAVLLVLSYALGSYIGYIYSFSSNAMFTFALAISIFISFSVFGPKYLANKQAIAEYMAPYYKMEEDKLKMQFQNILDELTKASEETKKDSNES